MSSCHAPDRVVKWTRTYFSANELVAWAPRLPLSRVVESQFQQKRLRFVAPSHETVSASARLSLQPAGRESSAPCARWQEVVCPHLCAAMRFCCRKKKKIQIKRSDSFQYIAESLDRSLQCTVARRAPHREAKHRLAWERDWGGKQGKCRFEVAYRKWTFADFKSTKRFGGDGGGRGDSFWKITW